MPKKHSIFHEYVFSGGGGGGQFPQENPPKVCTRCVQFQSQKCKSSFVWEGGHVPLPDPPPARATSRNKKKRFPYKGGGKSCPPTKKFLRTALIMFINDLPSVADSQMKLFADDTKLYRTVDTKTDADLYTSKGY